MKRIGIEVNGVLRDTIEKFKQVYEKQLIDNQECSVLFYSTKKYCISKRQWLYDKNRTTFNFYH